MKNYLRLIAIFLFLSLPLFGFAQIDDSRSPTTTQTIAGLTVYPNPVNNGKLYITTSRNLSKDIDIYDVLGKKVVSTSLFGKELNISKLTPGVYILKIKESDISATRKLVVR